MKHTTLGVKLITSASCTSSWTTAPFSIQNCSGFAVQITTDSSASLSLSSSFYPQGTFNVQVSCDGGASAFGDDMGSSNIFEKVSNWATLTGSVVSGSAGPSPIIYNVDGCYGTYARVQFVSGSNSSSGYATVKPFAKGPV